MNLTHLYKIKNKLTYIEINIKCINNLAVFDYKKI